MKTWTLRALPGLSYTVRKIELPAPPPVVEGDVVSPPEEVPELFELDIHVPDGSEAPAFQFLIGQLQGSFNSALRAQRGNAPPAAARPAVVIDHEAPQPQGVRHANEPRPHPAPRPAAAPRIPGAPPRHSPPSSSLQRRPPGPPPNEGAAHGHEPQGRERRGPPASPSLARRGVPNG